MTIAVILIWISAISAVFPLIAALYNYRKLDRVLKIFAAYCLFAGLIDLFSILALELGAKNNYPFFHLYNLVTAIVFTVIYYMAFYESVLKKVALIIGFVGIAAIIADMVLLENILTYPSVSNTILCLQLIILSLTYFYQLLTRQEFVHIDKQGLFWVNAGVLFYFSINIFLFMLFSKISKDAAADFEMIQSVTNIIANLLFSVGLLCQPQKTA